MEEVGWTSLVSKLDCLEWVDDMGLKGAKTSTGIDARAGGDVRVDSRIMVHWLAAVLNHHSRFRSQV